MVPQLVEGRATICTQVAQLPSSKIFICGLLGRSRHWALPRPHEHVWLVSLVSCVTVVGILYHKLRFT